MSEDKIYANGDSDNVNAFEFNQDVVDVFEDMIGRSVPHYLENLDEMVALALHAFQKGSNVYDLGCSKGALSLPLALPLSKLDGTVYAVDNSPDMIAAIRSKCGALPIHVLCQTVQETEIQNASVVILNYVLQFIPQAERIDILQRIYDGMLPGGVLLFSEKICHADPVLNQTFIDRHHAFKKANGYTLLEISRKRQALEDVLIPETLQAHMDRLQQVGFQVAEVWDQHYNFVSIYCRK
jgi:tRNA (cmo5U34)-methyltransferase